MHRLERKMYLSFESVHQNAKSIGRSEGFWSRCRSGSVGRGSASAATVIRDGGVRRSIMAGALSLDLRERVIAAYKDGEAREAWFEGQLDLDPERVVLIDDTAAATNMKRRYDRAPRGERCRIPCPTATTRPPLSRAPCRRVVLVPLPSNLRTVPREASDSCPTSLIRSYSRSGRGIRW